MGFLGDLGLTAPSISMGVSTTALLIGIIAFLILIIGAVVIWMWYMNKLFYIKVQHYEYVGSNPTPTKTFFDTARLIKVGDGGEEILLLRKKKEYRTAYGKKMGNNEYWFVKGQDGYWYNSVMGDFDAKMGMLDIEPIDRDMRYMNTAIRKNIQDRYRKVGIMEKYGSLIIGGVFLIIMGILVWLLIGKAGDLIKTATASQEVGKQTLEVVRAALANVDKVCSGGAGYVVQ